MVMIIVPPYRMVVRSKWADECKLFSQDLALTKIGTFFKPLLFIMLFFHGQEMTLHHISQSRWGHFYVCFLYFSFFPRICITVCFYLLSSVILLPAFIKVFSFPSPVFCLHLGLPLSLWTTPAEKSQSSVLLKLLFSPFLSSLLEKLEECHYFGVFWFVSGQLLPCNHWLAWRLGTAEQSSLLWQQCLLGSPPLTHCPQALFPLLSLKCGCSSVLFS